MYEDICYKNPFLKEVIFKADFPSPPKNIAKELPDKLLKAILLRFPISEPQKAHAQELQFAGDAVHAKKSEFMQWVFHGKSREKSLTITPDAFSYTNRSYETYEKLVEDIVDILKVFFENLKDVTASRVGLRYINVISVNENNPLVWKDYINEEMLGVIDFHDENEFLTRAFHILEYNFDGLAVKYQFGIANPDYPAVIRKKQFVIDVDAYSHGAFEHADISQFIEDGHSKIQEIFEKTITDKTRGLMEPQDVE